MGVPLMAIEETAFTLTVAVALTLLSTALVAVMVAVPAETAVTLPAFTVATLVLDEVQVIELLAPEGDTVAVRVCVPPATRLRVV